MYTKRIQISNYGPIDHLDIPLPFNGENPKPILLVGENGSGKSILLSHIVDGLMVAQGAIYPENSEVEQGKVYKLFSPSYIKVGREYSWGRIDFEKSVCCEQLELNRKKKDFPEKPAELSESAKSLWDSISDNETHSDKNNYYENNRMSITDIFNSNCILYFPPDRFEEPAWLNEENLRAKAQYMNLKRMQGYTDRKIINDSPLHDNQNWLFEVVYDRAAFEINTRYLTIRDKVLSVPLFEGYSGVSASIYGFILSVIRTIFRMDGNLRFEIENRHNRSVFLMREKELLVPNIFQLSTGETSLLNLFLSILRDFDATRTPFEGTSAVRGIVVVDEIDLHLHAIHQHEILPKLVKMFPRVQFIVTTHSPLFVLGMQKTFGEDGFALYRLPQGQQISPEEFSEFGSAYQSFMETKIFSDDMQQAVQDAQKPIVFVEGTTDAKYLEKAAEWLNKTELLKDIQIRDGGGFGNLNNIWRKFDSKLAELAEIIPQKIILLYDCDKSNCASKGNVFKRNIPKQENHPLQTGIENLFEEAILEKAKESKPAFIDVTKEHTKTERGQEITIPEKWTVNVNEKSHLCSWLCENGTAEDFKHFRCIFNLLEEILINDEGVIAPTSPRQPPQAG